MGWTTEAEIWLFFCPSVAVVCPALDGCVVLKEAGKPAWRALFLDTKSAEQKDGSGSDVSAHESPEVARNS